MRNNTNAAAVMGVAAFVGAALGTISTSLVAATPALGDAASHHHAGPAVRVADGLHCWHQEPMSLGVVPSIGVDCRTAEHGRFFVLHYRNFPRAKRSWMHWLDGGDWIARKRAVFVIPYEGNHPYDRRSAKWAAGVLDGKAFNGDGHAAQNADSAAQTAAGQ